MDQNLWIGVGRLVREPELIPAGRTGNMHIKFLLAVNRVVPRNSGPKTDYIPCVYWCTSSQAREALTEMSKGSEVAVSGRIYTDMVQGGNGRREFFWEVRVDELQPGRMSLKNLAAKVSSSPETTALDRLHKEFGE